MNINGNYLQRLIKDVDAYNYGPDYLRLVVNDELQFGKRFELLNNSNSNAGFVDGESFTYSLQKDSKRNNAIIWVACSIDDVSYPLFNIHDFRNKPGCITNKFSINFFSTTFRLIEMGKLPNVHDLVYDFFGEEDAVTLLDAKIGRYDWKVDLLYKNKRRAPSYKKLVECRDTITKNSFTIDEKTIAEYQRIASSIKGGQKLAFETTQIKEGEFCSGWSLGNKKNRNIMMRCYEKNIDSIAKGKYGLYSDYFQYANVWRIECEFHEQFLKENTERYHFDILDELDEKAFYYFGLNGYNKNKKYFYTANNSLDAVNIKYKRNYASRGNTLIQNNENPFLIQYDYLIKEKGNDEQFVQSLLKKVLHHENEKDKIFQKNEGINLSNSS